MYTVMLLDDEPWELRGMRAMIPWEAHGFSVAHALDDATQALEILLHQPVDVLLTDIRMPRLSGVDLLVRLREAGLETTVIFLSGYAEFSYAQTAVKMGAFDYLLKPFDQQDMPGFLARLRGHLDAKQQVTSLLLYEKLLHHAEAPETVLPNCTPDTHVRTLMCRAGDGPNAPRIDFPCTVFRLPCARDAWLYLLVYGGSMPDIAGHIGPGTPACGISEECAAAGLSLSQLIEHAAYAFYEGYITRREEIVLYRAGNVPATEAIIQAYAEAHAEGNIAGLRRLAAAMPDQLRAMDATMADVLHLWNACVFTCCRRDGLYTQLQCDMPADIVRQYPALENMAEALYQLAYTSLHAKQPEGTSQGKKTFEAMLLHIAQAYASPLSLPSVAGAAGTNTTTANKLFRQHAGTTFARYLTDFRINKACQMMAEDTRSIEEIGYLVGYADYFYFNKVFKKQLGITPYQYRKQTKEERAIAREW